MLIYSESFSVVKVRLDCPGLKWQVAVNLALATTVTRPLCIITWHSSLAARYVDDAFQLFVLIFTYIKTDQLYQILNQHKSDISETPTEKVKGQYQIHLRFWCGEHLCKGRLCMQFLMCYCLKINNLQHYTTMHAFPEEIFPWEGLLTEG